MCKPVIGEMLTTLKMLSSTLKWKNIYKLLAEGIPSPRPLLVSSPCTFLLTVILSGHS